MSAQPAYTSYPERSPRSFEPHVRVVRGARSRSQAPAMPANALFAAKVLAVLLVVLAAVAFVRVGLSAAAVSESISSQQLSSQISDARSEGAALEVTQSTLSNPQRVRQQAAALGMAAATEVGTLVLPEDIVATGDDGALSLSESVARAASPEA